MNVPTNAHTWLPVSQRTRTLFPCFTLVKMNSQRLFHSAAQPAGKRSMGRRVFDAQDERFEPTLKVQNMKQNLIRCGTNCPHSPRISFPSSYFEMFTLSASSSALDDRQISKCSKSSLVFAQKMSTPHMSFRSSFSEMLSASLRYIDTAALNLHLDKIKLNLYQKRDGFLPIAFVTNDLQAYSSSIAKASPTQSCPVIFERPALLLARRRSLCPGRSDHFITSCAWELWQWLCMVSATLVCPYWEAMSRAFRCCFETSKKNWNMKDFGVHTNRFYSLSFFEARHLRTWSHLLW